MKQTFKYINFLLLVLSSFSVSAESERIVITGSSTVAPLVLEIAKRFEKLHEGVRVDVQTGGSSRGINDVRNNLVEIGMVSRELYSSEADLNSYIIATDGIGIVVNKQNLIDQLTKNQIIDIYTGNITNWNQVGGEDKKIVVVNKAEGRSTLELFLKYFNLKNSQIKASVIVGDNQQGIKMVAGNPTAIAYISIGSAEFETKYGTPIKTLPLLGYEASVESLREGVFPLQRQLNLVTKGDISELSQMFIDFAQSQEVHDLIKSQYFTPIESSI